MGVLLALRRLQRSEIASFLADKDPALVLEAARAINDEPINGAMQELAALIDAPSMNGFLSGTPLVPDSVPKNAAYKLGLEALLRRVLNANFHFGTPKTANALVTFAARSDAPVNMRAEALEELANWEHPAGIDRVVGLWRPVAAVRHHETAAEVVEPRLSELLGKAPKEVQVAALRCVDQLRITSAGNLLWDAVTNSALPGVVRTEALRTIGDLDLPELERALGFARDDADEEVRKAATRLEGKLANGNAVGRIATTLEKGTIGERQTALSALSALPGKDADELVDQWLDRLQADNLPKELRLDVLQAAGKRSAPMIRQKLGAYEANCSKNNPLGLYEASLYGGTKADGKKVFFEKPEAQCVRCHRINGQGGDVGPDLSHIGTQKDRRYLLESIVLPNKQIAQGFDSVMVMLKNGETQAGVLKSETPDQLVLNSADNGAVTLSKADIRSRKAALSPMPEGLGQILSGEDLRNLIEFLSSLK
jgi:quinoprotein glucose dehydrogenase